MNVPRIANRSKASWLNQTSVNLLALLVIHVLVALALLKQSSGSLLISPAIHGLAARTIAI